MRLPRPTFLVGFAAFAALSLSAASADTPKVTAALSNDHVAVGEPVQLQIRVTGGGGSSVPSDIAIDGLEIHPTGTSRQVEVQNFNISQSIIYNFTILPMRSGTFRIPPQTVKIGGNSYRTPELQLIVEGDNAPNSGAGGNSPRSGRIERDRQAPQLGFAEIIVTKPTAYVGEIVPVEIRLGLNAHTRPRLVDGPEVPSQSFTMQKLQPPDQPRMETINGVPYEVLTFKTAIAATRPGKFEIGPVQAGALVRVNRQQGSSRSRGNSPFDVFNLDDPFADPFFADPFNAGGRQEKITLKSQPAAVEIKPLPSNAPASFGGAVGNFNLHVDANPKKVQVGDPITVTATIGGRGNFDRVTAPALQDDRGWHDYPPSSKFKQDDDVGMSGTKTFEAVISPNERKDSIPPLEFTYFDPLADKYVTLKSDPIPIHVEGEALPAAKAPSGSGRSAAATPAQAPTAAPAIAARPGEILTQLDQRSQVGQTFVPLFQRKNFWFVQGIPLVVVLGLMMWRFIHARHRDEAAMRTAAWQRELGELRRRLRSTREKPAEFFAAASRILQIRTALLTGSDPETVSASEAGAALKTDDQTRARIREIFDRRDELRYSGSTNGDGSLGAADREHFAQLVEDLAR